MTDTRNRRSAGFTLLEVMLVMLILGMLVGVGIYGYSKSQEKAEKQSTAITVAELENAVRQYRRVVRSYPEESDGLNALTTPPDEDAPKARS